MAPDAENEVMKKYLAGGFVGQGGGPGGGGYE